MGPGAVRQRASLYTLHRDPSDHRTTYQTQQCRKRPFENSPDLDGTGEHGAQLLEQFPPLRAFVAQLWVEVMLFPCLVGDLSMTAVAKVPAMGPTSLAKERGPASSSSER